MARLWWRFGSAVASGSVLLALAPVAFAALTAGPFRDGHAGFVFTDIILNEKE